MLFRFLSALSFLGANFCFTPAVQAQSQDKIDQAATEILQEGLALYQSERASWIGTDLLKASGADLSQVGGYVSYAVGTDSVRYVFFQKAPADAALRVFYGYDFPKKSIALATGRVFANRAATSTEQLLFAIRQRAMAEMASHEKLGQPYQKPAGTNLNIALLDKGSEVRAYLLTGPTTETVLPIGKDYLLTFSPAGQLLRAERLHNSYIPMAAKVGGESIKGTIHTHLEAHPYVTPTDICNALLYQEVVPASELYVMSKDFVSIFDVPKQQLVILTKKAWDKINQSQANQKTNK